MQVSMYSTAQARGFASRQHPAAPQLSQAHGSAASHSSSRQFSSCKGVVQTRIHRSRLPAAAACRLASWQPAVHTSSLPCSSNRSAANATHSCAATPTSGSSSEALPASDSEAATPSGTLPPSAKPSADAASESSPTAPSNDTVAKADEVELLPGTVYDVEELRGVRVNVDENQAPLVEYLVNWKVHFS